MHLGCKMLSLMLLNVAVRPIGVGEGAGASMGLEPGVPGLTHFMEATQFFTICISPAGIELDLGMVPADIEPIKRPWVGSPTTMRPVAIKWLTSVICEIPPEVAEPPWQ